jgi:hypothetical protein
MELKWFDGLLVCSRPELLQRSLLHHQARRDFTVIRQKVELLMAVICAAPRIKVGIAGKFGRRARLPNDQKMLTEQMILSASQHYYT